MPASRWNVDFHEIIEWVIKGEQEFSQILLNFDLEDSNQSDDRFLVKTKSKPRKNPNFQKLSRFFPCVDLSFTRRQLCH